VRPKKEEIQMDEPVIIRQGNKFGVKIRSEAPSIHMIRANIETEIAPIVGSEKQAQDLIDYIKSERGGGRPAAARRRHLRSRRRRQAAGRQTSRREFSGF
ncbi:hypothetical protein J6B78_04560, partial [Methanocorpusculum sp.]|nr:hypothetical protein [Methanocorpusculum sp.]